MAQFLATLTTLANFKAQVRGQLGAVSDQESGILNIEMNDLVHQSITSVRTLLGKLLNDFYRTRNTSLTVAGSNPNYTADISALEIFDVNDMSLYTSGLGEIPIVSGKKFNAYRSLYTAAEIGTGDGIATVANTTTAAATQSVLTIYIYSNAAAAPTPAELVYSRYPKKVTTDANTLDLPETFIPLARDICTLYVEKRLSRTPSADVVNAVNMTIDPLVALGVTQPKSELVRQ